MNSELESIHFKSRHQESDMRCMFKTKNEMVFILSFSGVCSMTPSTTSFFSSYIHLVFFSTFIASAFGLRPNKVAVVLYV